MGRKFLTTAVVAAAVVGGTAGSALAKPLTTSFSNGKKASPALAAKLNAGVRSAAKATGPGDAVVVNHAVLSECTAATPGTATGYTNFFTKDTTNYVEFGGFLLVGECSADLTKKQTGASASDHPIGKVMVPFGGYHTYTEECAIAYKGGTYYGDAESISYPDGEFIETCIAPVSA